MNFEIRGLRFRSQNKKKQGKIDAERGKAPEAHFDRFWMDFGKLLASQNRPKTLKNRCRNALEN